MKCPTCGKELWEVKQTVYFSNKEEQGHSYQCPVILYWCADGCSMDEGCGYSRLVIED